LVIVVAHHGVTWNAERGKGILDQGQLRRRAVVGKVASEQTKLCGGRARFHLARHVIEPRAARFFESVQVVYRDECEIVGARSVCAAQAARPNTER
jgi:hypothetical protein